MIELEENDFNELDPLADNYISLMDTKLERMILAKFGEFLSSDQGKTLAKQKDSLGGKIRAYKTRYQKGELTAIAALSLLMDCGMVEDVKFSEIK